MQQIQNGSINEWCHYCFVRPNKEKLTMSTKEDNNGSKESKEPDYEDKDQLEEKQEEKTGELNENETTEQVFELGQKQQIRITHKR